MTYQATHLFLVCCSGSSPAPCSTSIFCFVMATPKAEARAAAARAAVVKARAEAVRAAVVRARVEAARAAPEIRS